MIPSFVSTFLNGLSGVTSFASFSSLLNGLVSGALGSSITSDRRLKSDVVAVSWSR